MPRDQAVELVDVTKTFGQVVAVDQINLAIQDGEFFSLLGPSGCGKTTTLRMIAGFEMPSAGELYIGGEMQGYLPAYKRPVNTVFQHYALFPHMTVWENVAFGLRMQKVDRSEVQLRVGEAMELVHLSGMEKRKPKQLSGGQQQRVALARALVNHPKVLLLDEPLGALDLKLRRAMQIELKSLQENVGITFIYVTHDQEEALTMSDRIGVMNQGQLLQVGSALEIYESPATRFVSDFIGETNYIPGIFNGVEGGHSVVTASGGTKLLAAPREELRRGEEVVIAVRPERMAVNQKAGKADNQLKARVKDVIYYGSSTAYVIGLADGSEVTARRQNDEGPAIGVRVGEEATISWPVAASRVFRTR